VLHPVLARHVGSLEEPVMQLRAQHAPIRGLVMQLSDEAVWDRVRREIPRSLGGRLEDNARLEDLVVLPLDEETLPEHALEAVASRLEAYEIGGLPAEPRLLTGGSPSIGAVTGAAHPPNEKRRRTGLSRPSKKTSASSKRRRALRSTPGSPSSAVPIGTRNTVAAPGAMTSNPGAGKTNAAIADSRPPGLTVSRKR
jgi:hypothetical protein